MSTEVKWNETSKSDHRVSQYKLRKNECGKRQEVLFYGTAFNMKTNWLFIIFFELEASSEALLSPLPLSRLFLWECWKELMNWATSSKVFGKPKSIHHFLAHHLSCICQQWTERSCGRIGDWKWCTHTHILLVIGTGGPDVCWVQDMIQDRPVVFFSWHPSIVLGLEYCGSIVNSIAVPVPWLCY